MVPDKSFDILLPGHSLHDFGTHRKAILLKRFKSLLKPDAVLIVYDLFKREEEERPAYLERLLAHCRTH